MPIGVYDRGKGNKGWFKKGHHPTHGFKKGFVPWIKGKTKKDYPQLSNSLGTKKKGGSHRKGQLYPHTLGCVCMFNRKKQNEKNPNWRGESVGYQGIHKWLRKNYGEASHCINPRCTKKSKKFHWSKKDHSTPYRRRIRDFQQLCAVCHRLYDTGKMRIR